MHKTILSDQEAKVLAFYVLTKKITYRYFYCFLATLLEIGWGFRVGMEHIVIFLIKRGGVPQVIFQVEHLVFRKEKKINAYICDTIENS